MKNLKWVGVWIAVIAVVFGVQIFGSVVGGVVGVPMTIDVDPYTIRYGRGAEAERDSVTSAFGWGFNILSIVAAVAVWYLLNGKRGSKEDEGFFCGWLVGGLILVLLGIPRWHLAYIDEIPNFAFLFVDVGLWGLAFYVGRMIYLKSLTADGG